MSLSDTYLGGIWHVDFEFHPLRGLEGNTPVPVCMVAHDVTSGRTMRLWQDELVKLERAPFPTDDTALFVAYFATAEMSCFLSLGWALPVNILDLYVEFRVATNGVSTAHKNGLLAAMQYFGIAGAIESYEKEYMRDLILSQGPWSEEQCLAIIDYCESDVLALVKLLPAMLPNIDLPRAILRGEYMRSVAHIEANGVPIDHELFRKLQFQWEDIKTELIQKVDKQFGVFVDGIFKVGLFESYLAAAGIPWLQLPSGKLDMREETFKEIAQIYPQITPLKELRSSLSKMRLSMVSLGEDGRNRCLLSPFSSSTGRNQPSTSRFIFGPATWMRGLIKPAEGRGIAYIDWSQQEFGIAAALSNDSNMMNAYRSGDPYLAFAIQAGVVPADATKQSHKVEREQFKAAVLAVQYGMGPEKLAFRIKQPVARARQLLDLHRKTYKAFWRWSDNCLDEAILGGKLWTNFGWEIQVKSNPNDRSLRNFPVQASGAEMLRIACILLTRAGIQICAPVHDAILIEAPLSELDSIIKQTQQLMCEASRIVLCDFELASDAKVIRYPDRYMDDRGLTMWNTIMELIGENKHV